MRDALFACGTPFHGKPGHETALHEIERVIAKTAGVRRFGAASLDLAYVAAGRFDGYWERNLGVWDIAAGAVLVREAGGTVNEIDGGDFMQTGAIVASNPSLIAPLTQTLRAGGSRGRARRHCPQQTHLPPEVRGVRT